LTRALVYLNESVAVFPAAIPRFRQSGNPQPLQLCSHGRFRID
jgi:hypothetical protein